MQTGWAISKFEDGTMNQDVTSSSSKKEESHETMTGVGTQHFQRKKMKKNNKESRIIHKSKRIKTGNKNYIEKKFKVENKTIYI